MPEGAQRPESRQQGQPAEAGLQPGERGSWRGGSKGGRWQGQPRAVGPCSPCGRPPPQQPPRGGAQALKWLYTWGEHSRRPSAGAWPGSVFRLLGPPGSSQLPERHRHLPGRQGGQGQPRAGPPSPCLHSRRGWCRAENRPPQKKGCEDQEGGRGPGPEIWEAATTPGHPCSPPAAPRVGAWSQEGTHPGWGDTRPLLL